MTSRTDVGVYLLPFRTALSRERQRRWRQWDELIAQHRARGDEFVIASQANSNHSVKHHLDPAKIKSKNVLVFDLISFIRKYVVLSREQLLVIVLWTIHTHCVDAVDDTPYLSITSPERRCGKTRLLEVLELLILKPWICILPSEASVYRRLNREHPTLMLDEVDTIYGKTTKDKYEGLRAMLDSGSRRGVPITRAIGATNKLEIFDVFGPKVLAGIGGLPDTVADRSIPIRLQRRTREEPVTKLRRRQVAPVAGALKDQLIAWVEEHVETLEGAEPDMPEELNDRAQDSCECLVAIADELGVGYEARKALVSLYSAERLDDMESLRVKLLRDLKTVFGSARAMPTQGEDGILVALWSIDESPWGRWYGRGFESRDLASLLGHFDVGPKTVKIEGKAHKGYHRNDLAELWERYR